MIAEQTFANGIVLQYGFHAKRNKEQNYDIYVRFHFIQRGIRLHEMIITTGVTCTPAKWNGTSVVVKAKDFNAQMKNEKLDTIKVQIRDGLHELKKKKVSNLSDLKDEITHGIKPAITNKPPKGERPLFLSRLQAHSLEGVKQSYLLGKNYSQGYQNKFTDVIRLLQEFYGYAPNIDEIDKDDVKRFKAWMEQKSFTLNTVSTYLNKLRTLFLHAVDKGILAKTPIPRKGMVEGYERGRRSILTDEEIGKICALEDCELSSTLKQTKYVFLFMAATGIGYGELKAVRREHFQKVEGQLLIEKPREKTGVPYTVPFSPLAESVYNGFFNWITHETGVKTSSEPFANLPSIEYITRTFKKIATMAGIDKNVTSYTPRHTFATNYIAEGGSIDVLKDILGHTDIRTTQIYVKLLKRTIIQESNNTFARSKFHNLNIKANYTYE